ncbi:MAG: aspartate kinase [Carnobacterium sp.]|uniref:aspartate kinase n=1 Tax=unclassified Carnobacterium TaxID=257487 RepID=UPI001911DD54|nr:aspartate kinase [Carnobacterium sp. CS13]QQP69738.1 aspartate kinase [Carnobacterium sp. CS13]
MNVVKFGGSSLASGSQLKKVLQIVKGDKARKVVVVSAPGKRSSDDEKVTDLLIDLGMKALAKQDYQAVLSSVIARYSSIAEELNLGNEIIDEIELNLAALVAGNKQEPDYYLDAFKASGEDNNAKLVAAYFNHEGLPARYVNPQEAGLIVTNEPGNARVLPEAYEKLQQLRASEEVIIFPGFFGYTKDGKVCTFSRGGSDITGAILANGTQADLYENFTDVDAIYVANPNVVENPKGIKTLTYREMRELSYAGFSVLHDEALQPAFKQGIPVQIKNTNNPEAPGTSIVKERHSADQGVVGIASSHGFCSIYIEKYLMNREIGFGRRVLEILEDQKLSYEHMPSGIDDLTIILRDHQLSDEGEAALLERLRVELEADSVVVERNLALIMIVGEGMRRKIGTMSKAATAFAESNINIDMINQGASEVSVMFGIAADQEDKAIQALYKAFFE